MVVITSLLSLEQAQTIILGPRTKHPVQKVLLFYIIDLVRYCTNYLGYV